MLNLCEKPPFLLFPVCRVCTTYCYTGTMFVPFGLYDACGVNRSFVIMHDWQVRLLASIITWTRMPGYVHVGTHASPSVTHVSTGACTLNPTCEYMHD